MHTLTTRTHKYTQILLDTHKYVIYLMRKYLGGPEIK